jgi:hypothetical protein
LTRRRLWAAALAALVLSLAAPAAAGAHGIAQRADLPIPEWLFAWGAALVLLASFVGLAVLWRRPVLATARERRLLPVPFGFDVLAGALGVAVFAIVVYAGLAGNQTATANLAPTMVFVIFWVGVPCASVLLGDVWAAFSPWRAAGRATGWAARHVSRGELPTPFTYPERLGRWPAAFVILAFAWVELVDLNRTSPSHLAILALVYAALMLVGMSLYGVEAWTRNADGFAVAFGLLALLAPLTWVDRELRLRPPLAGAIAMPQVSGAIAVVITMIGTTTFDGFSQGSIWTGTNGLLQRLTDTFDGIGLGREAAIQGAGTVGLLAVVLLVAGLYRLGIAGMHSVDGTLSSNDLARRFAHTLIPISFAYLVAHYFSLLLFQGQAVIFLASDPLGQGSDLLGTSASTIDYSLIGANGIWYVQVAALVTGHVAALILAHDRALELWSDSRTATRSQYWMLLVMITFTCLGLWLLSAASQ